MIESAPRAPHFVSQAWECRVQCRDKILKLFRKNSPNTSTTNQMLIKFGFYALQSSMWLPLNDKIPCYHIFQLQVWSSRSNEYTFKLLIIILFATAYRIFWYTFQSWLLVHIFRYSHNWCSSKNGVGHVQRNNCSGATIMDSVE